MTEKEQTTYDQLEEMYAKGFSDAVVPICRMIKTALNEGEVGKEQLSKKADELLAFYDTGEANDD